MSLPSYSVEILARDFRSWRFKKLETFHFLKLSLSHSTICFQCSSEHENLCNRVKIWRQKIRSKLERERERETSFKIRVSGRRREINNLVLDWHINTLMGRRKRKMLWGQNVYELGSKYMNCLQGSQMHTIYEFTFIRKKKRTHVNSAPVFQLYICYTLLWLYIMGLSRFSRIDTKK